MEPKLDRRTVLKTAGGVGLAAAFGARALSLLSEDALAADAASTCLLTPEATEGPYWVEHDMTRRNITEGKPGTPLVIRFTVLNARTCRIIKNTDVEIWHCDAVGDYSAVSGASTRFLRGHQRSNANGIAEFLTVFPGWYRGRTPHIHMKVSVGGNEVHTGQIFFNETITRTVYKQKPYAARGTYDTPHAQDMIYRQAGGSKAELKLKRRTGGLKGYVGTIAIGVVT
ncbi:MAG: intradiol ring-cleavage dioxygenase [Actinobacteria bacterium]|nr:intradiol ring-cleavage dioxygenase [Actinomycetota bacterium]